MTHPTNLWFCLTPGGKSKGKGKQKACSAAKDREMMVRVGLLWFITVYCY
jgi:hypothetical protein